MSELPVLITPGSEPPRPEFVESAALMQCPVCHNPVEAAFYFCPNCGKSLKEKPLSTSVSAQINIYLLSIITPPMCFLTVKWWHGVKYLRAEDPGAKRIGLIATILLAVSTLVSAWLLYALTVQLMQSLSGGLLGGAGSGLGF